MRVVPVPNGRFLENSYLVLDQDAGVCAVIDPGEEPGLILHKITAASLRVDAIWLTHAHIDHVVGVGRMKRETSAPVYLHPADLPLYDHVAEQAAMFGMGAEPQPAPDRAFSQGDTLTVGALRFQVRHTPGHSPGSVSIVGQGVAFTGDALFRGSIGRTDLPGGDFETLIHSIERELLTLPDGTIVYSGHGTETTVGQERRYNPFLTGAARPA